MGYRHMHLEQLAAGLDAADKALQCLPLSHLLGESGDDCVPVLVIEATGNTLIHEDFHITLGFADENQHAGTASRMVQVLLQKLSARQV
ncbi:hypothetical protein D3C76_1737680 [compost metagenome]